MTSGRKRRENDGGTMDKRERIKTAVIYGVFICYIVLLIKILLLSRVSLSDLFSGQGAVSRSINIIPFQSVMQYFATGSETVKSFAFGNVVGNILMFIPLGVYLPLLRKDKRAATALLFIFIVSLSVEIVQGVLGIGTADIDDIILNTLGGWIGILGYKLFSVIFRDERKVRTTIAILSVVIGLPVVFYLLFMIKMRF
jgi:glycopeptide antibiotics resistance protein